MPKTEDPEKLVRMFFPLLLTKRGNPRRRQPNVEVGMDGYILQIKRGVVVEAPAWVPLVLKHFNGSIPGSAPECFVSMRPSPGFIREARAFAFEEAAEIASAAWNNASTMVTQKEHALRMEAVFLRKAKQVREGQASPLLKESRRPTSWECAFCGEVNHDRAICPKCERTHEDTIRRANKGSDKWTCLRCDAKNQRGSFNCHNCGQLAIETHDE